MEILFIIVGPSIADYMEPALLLTVAVLIGHVSVDFRINTALVKIELPTYQFISLRVRQSGVGGVLAGEFAIGA
jgi:hypothetical protein